MARKSSSELKAILKNTDPGKHEIAERYWKRWELFTCAQRDVLCGIYVKGGKGPDTSEKGVQVAFVAGEDLAVADISREHAHDVGQAFAEVAFLLMDLEEVGDE